MPSLAGWLLLTQDFQNAEEGALQRRMSGLHRVLESHVGHVAREFFAIEAALVIKPRRVAEVPARREKVVLDSVQRASVKVARSPAPARVQRRRAGWS